MAATKDRQYRGVRVMVLGAAGFVGRWVGRQLTHQEARLYLLDCRAAGSEKIFERFGVRGEVLEADATEAETLDRIYREIRPSITFNCVAYGVDPAQKDPALAKRINSDLVEALCRVVARNREAEWGGQDLVHIGSALEYGQAGGILSEESHPQPTSLYGITKLSGTRVVTHSSVRFGFKGITVRLFTVYGPGERDGRLLPSLIEISRRRQAIDLTAGLQERDFTFMPEAADGLLKLGLSAALPGEAINLATGRLTSVRGFVEIAARVLGIADQNLRFGVLPTRQEEMTQSGVSVERLRRLTAWIPSVSIAEGIRKTAEFLQAPEQASQP
jgi:UDP-glucose 4-epimerase